MLEDIKRRRMVGMVIVCKQNFESFIDLPLWVWIGLIMTHREDPSFNILKKELPPFMKKLIPLFRSFNYAIEPITISREIDLLNKT